MARRRGSLEHDQEINSAAWAATRGAVVGAAKVRNPVLETYSIRRMTDDIVDSGEYSLPLPLPLHFNLVLSTGD